MIVNKSKLLYSFLILFSMAEIILGQKNITKKKRPNWISQPPSNCYVGISDLRESEKEARNQAVKDAKRQIIASLGGVIESKFVDHIIEHKGDTKYSSSFTESKVKVVS